MLIIGVDYHPSFQQISFLDQETGECGDRRLNHSDGEAERFYKELKERGVSVRVGLEATGYSRWFERLLAELGFEVCRHSDRVHERRLHAVGAMLFGGCCILLAVATIPHSLSIAFALIILSGVGAYGPMGAFWAIPTETLPPAIVGSAMGLINAIGNLGAYFAPLIVGYLNKQTGTFLAGFTYLGAITLVGAGLAAMLRTAPENGS
jgi:hypothetical protein